MGTAQITHNSSGIIEMMIVAAHDGRREEELDLLQVALG